MRCTRRRGGTQSERNTQQTMTKLTNQLQCILPCTLLAAHAHIHAHQVVLSPARQLLGFGVDAVVKTNAWHIRKN